MTYQQKPSTVTTGPIIGSRKIYTSPQGTTTSPCRSARVALDPSATEPPVRLYDTSGAYTDDNAAIDLTAGLPRVRGPWLARRGFDTPVARAVKPRTTATTDRLVPECPAERPVLAGKPGGLVTQMEFARAGIITEEMIYCAHRENLGRAKMVEGAEARRAQGEDFGASIPAFVTPEFVPRRSGRRARDHSRQHQPPGAGADDSRPHFLVKINANIGNSAVTSSAAEEVEKLVWAIRWGADTVMDPVDRPQHPQHPRLDHAQRAGADRYRADLPGAGEGRRRRGQARLGGVPRHADRAGGAGVDYFTIHAGVRLAYVPLTATRTTGIVSRGGSIMARWCLAHHRESFLYGAFRRDLRHHAQV